MKPSLIRESVGQLWQLYHLRAEDYAFKWHCHAECELFVPLRGQGECLAGDFQGTYQPGEAYFLPPMVPHSFYTLGSTSPASQESYVLFFLPDSPLLSALREHADVPSLIARHAGGVRLTSSAALIQSLASCERSEGPFAAARFVETLGHLMALQGGQRLSRTDTSARRSSAGSDKRMDRIAAYLHQHCDRTVAIADVAAAAGLSPQSLCRFFRRHTGKTVMDYLQELRINRICRQLAHSDVPITELAFQGGFQTISHFNRTFRALKGMSPRQYRSRSHLAGIPDASADPEPRRCIAPGPAEHATAAALG